MLSFAPRPPTDAWLDRLDEVARKHLGRDSADVSALAQAVNSLSLAYTRRGRAIQERAREADDLWARLCFFLPRDLAKVQLPLLELAALNALPERDTLRVLDLGAGLGAVSLGIAQLCSQLGTTRLTVTAIDSDPRALKLFEAVAHHTSQLPGVPIDLELRAADLWRLPRSALCAPYDVIALGLAINESPQNGSDAAQPAEALLVQLASLLAPDGVIIVLEPALRETSRALQTLRDRLAARDVAPFVFAPCVHRGPCPLLASDRDWCHERVGARLPARLAQVAQQAGLRDRDLTFSYLTLHASDRNLRERSPGELSYRIVSGPLRSKGKLELAGCGEGGLTRLMRLDRDAATDVGALQSAGRGMVLSVGDRAPTHRLRLDAEVPFTVWQKAGECEPW